MADKKVKRSILGIPMMDITSGGTPSGRRGIDQAFGAQTKVTRSGDIIRRKPKKKRKLIDGL